MKQQTLSVLDALGVHLAGSGDLTVRSPIDGSVLAQLPTASAADMKAAVGRAAEAFKAWRVVPSTICSPSPSVRIALARPCHLPSGKKPVALMTSARTCSGCSQAHRSPMSPPQS